MDKWDGKPTYEFIKEMQMREEQVFKEQRGTAAVQTEGFKKHAP